MGFWQQLVKEAEDEELRMERERESEYRVRRKVPWKVPADLRLCLMSDVPKQQLEKCRAYIWYHDVVERL